MDFESTFNEENRQALFEPAAHAGEFIAEACDSYTAFGRQEDFGRKWALGFPAGRYVIVVLERLAVFARGKKIWQNEAFREEVGRDSRHRGPGYVIVLDKALEYAVPRWEKTLITHMLHRVEEPLQARIFTRKAAEEKARKYSECGFRAAVLEWFEDFDMY